MGLMIKQSAVRVKRGDAQFWNRVKRGQGVADRQPRGHGNVGDNTYLQEGFQKEAHMHEETTHRQNAKIESEL